MVPAVAALAILSFFLYNLTQIERPEVVEGAVTFGDGTVVSDLRYDYSGAEDGHRVAVVKLTPGTETDLTFALHLNDEKQNIVAKVGEFKLSQYCKGEQVKECIFPISREGLDRSASLGIAAYKVPGSLLQVKEGRSDWDNHRALFPTLASKRLD
jgi:hypothetical protein